MSRSRPPLSGLYAITPEFSDTRTLLAVSRAVLSGGCRWLQYRSKGADAQRRRFEAEALRALCADYCAAMIVNDDAGLACAVGADGVHLGRDDGSLAEARRMLGAAAVIGASCYDDPGRAVAAQAAGADYVAFGAVFASLTKPDAVHVPMELLSRASAELSVPVCAIGGITLERAPRILETGVRFLAVSGDLFMPEGVNFARQRDFNARLAAIAERARAYQQLFKDDSSP